MTKTKELPPFNKWGVAFKTVAEAEQRINRGQLYKLTRFA